MSEIITAKTNAFIKSIAKLKLKKYRLEEGLFIVESKKLVDEAVRSKVDVEYFIIRQDIEDFLIPHIRVSKEVFAHLSSMVSPDGYMAVVRISEKKELGNRIIILDKLQDPGNLGTIIRSAEAFGFSTILAVNSVDFYNEKTLRASMGSIFRLNLIAVKNFDRSLVSSYKIYAADLKGKDYRKENYPEKLALLIGNEAKGLSAFMRDMADEFIKIDMQGEVESLNAAVSASIIMAAIS